MVCTYIVARTTVVQPSHMPELAAWPTPPRPPFPSRAKPKTWDPAPPACPHPYPPNNNVSPPSQPAHSNPPSLPSGLTRPFPGFVLYPLASHPAALIKQPRVRPVRRSVPWSVRHSWRASQSGRSSCRRYYGLLRSQGHAPVQFPALISCLERGGAR